VTTIEPWCKRWPGRVRRELKALGSAGISYDIDREAYSKGQLILRLELPDPRGGGTLELLARFPGLYPYFRFEVIAPHLDLLHHQHALSKALCFIGRGTENWIPSTLLADQIQDRLGLVLRAGTTDDEDDPAVALEDHQAEPFSDYLPYSGEAMILTDGGLSIPLEYTKGGLILGLERPPSGHFRAAVLEVRSDSNRVLASAAASVRRLFPELFTGRWVRIPAAIRQVDPEEYLRKLVEHRPDLAGPRDQHAFGETFDLVGALVPEEVAWRRTGENWTFLLRMAPQVGKKSRPSSPRFVRTGRTGVSDLTSRIPELHALGGRKVAVVGLGGLGAPSCLEFARMGVGELVLVDHDFVDPSTAVRWPLGLQAAGRSKALVLEQFIRSNWPSVTVRPAPLRIGSEQTQEHVDILTGFLNDVDLILDASAEKGIQQFLSDVAREKKIPYVCVWTQPGAWGGLIARIDPAVTDGCWYCLWSKLTNGEIPYPPGDPAGDFQPAGCADPTFTGTGFDLTWIATSAVRMAAGSLSGNQPDSYPRGAWDVLILRTREDSGQPIPPTSEGIKLRRDPECKNCNKG
jgi:molybdopterin/thiamine biosynthesis adenylyltransferase